MKEEKQFIPRIEVSSEEVSSENAKKLEDLETDTNELYRNQVELWSIVDHISPYISELNKRRWVTINLPSGGTKMVHRPAGWKDVLILQELIKKRGLDEVISEEKIHKEVPEDKEWITDEIKRLLKDEQYLQRIQDLPIDEQRKILINTRITGVKKQINYSLELFDKIKTTLETPELKQYKVFRLSELEKAQSDIEKLETERAIIQLQLNYTIQNGSVFDEYYDELIKKDKDLYEKLDALYHSSPEAYLWKCGQNLLELKKNFDEYGNIVLTPYVKEKVMSVLNKVKERPVFIIGELSTGKTEFAKFISRKYLSQPYLKRWDEKNPKPKDPEKIKDWLRAREEAKEPLEIRGVRGMEKEDILAKTVLERAETPMPEKQVEFLLRAREDFRKDVIEKAASEIEDLEERKKFIESAIERLEQGYMEKWKSNIITLEKLSPIFQAMKEGRPVIFDEMNAVPHYVLIGLNDVINAKPGMSVFTPSGEEIIVQEGYVLLATGNWKPEDGELYPGRATIDGAYLSRFGVENFDFLPQSIQREIEGTDPEVLRKQRQENELFMMMMTRILDDQLGIKIPEGSIEKIKELARIARIIQDVFSGKSVDKSFWARGGKDDPKVVLKENVLAYRHLFPILERWKNEGFVRSLDDYIFMEYIQRSTMRPKEMKYLYNLLQIECGFFRGDDWPQSTGESDKDITEIMNYNIVKKIYGVDNLAQAKKPIPNSKIKKRYYSPKEIIEEIYGPVPERKRYKIEFLEEDPEKDINKLREQKFKATDTINSLLNNSNISETIKNMLKR